MPAEYDKKGRQTLADFSYGNGGTPLTFKGEDFANYLEDFYDISPNSDSRPIETQFVDFIMHKDLAQRKWQYDQDCRNHEHFQFNYPIKPLEPKIFTLDSAAHKAFAKQAVDYMKGNDLTHEHMAVKKCWDMFLVCKDFCRAGLYDNILNLIPAAIGLVFTAVHSPDIVVRQHAFNSKLNQLVESVEPSQNKSFKERFLGSFITQKSEESLDKAVKLKDADGTESDDNRFSNSNKTI